MGYKYALSTAALIAVLAFFPLTTSAALIDKVAAYIDNEAITQRELDEELAAAVSANPSATRLQVLNTMVNRRLLLREARRLRLQATDEESMLNDYINLKVKAFVRVTEPDIHAFYENNIEEFGGVTFEGVRDRIKGYLEEKEVNERLKELLDELRRKSYIRILIGPDA